MTTTETDTRLWNDPLWVAIQACIERLEDDPRKVLFEKTPGYEEGLDSDTINELSDAPVFSFGADGDTRTVRIHHPELPASACVSWVTWHRFSQLELPTSKLARTIEYLRAWQERRKGELVGAVCGDAAGRLVERHEESVVANVDPPRSDPPDSDTVAPINRTSGGKPRVNAMMLDAMQNDPSVLGFTAREWAQRLKCAPSSVTATKTWIDLAMARNKLKAERSRDRRAKTESGSGKAARRRDEFT